MSIHPKICQWAPFVGLLTSTPLMLTLLLLQTCRVTYPAGKSSAKAEKGARISSNPASNWKRNRFMSCSSALLKESAIRNVRGMNATGSYLISYTAVYLYRTVANSSLLWLELEERCGN